MCKFSLVNAVSTRAIVIISVLSIFASPMVNAQEKDKEKSADAARAEAGEETEEPEEEKPLFVVPEEGTANEYFAFINRVKRTRSKARDRKGAMAHFELQVEAILQACDKIVADAPDTKTEAKVIKEKFGALDALARVNKEASESGMKKLMTTLKADTRPEIVNLLAQRKLEAKLATVSQMSADEQAAFVEECFEMADENGLDNGLFRVLSSIGRKLGYSDTPEVGVALYKRLADAMEKSEDPDLIERADKARGSARRLELPGNFMEIVGKTAEGDNFDWASYRGKVVLVDFWASWCGPCRREIPNMKQQLENYSSKGFDIVGVNLDNTKAAYQKYVDDQELTWTNLMSGRTEEMGWNNPLAVYYGVSGIPTAILVDKEGKVVSMNARGSQLNTLLEDLLGPVEEENEPATETETAGDE